MATSTNVPLTGLRVLVTRARTQAGALTELLRQRGATVVELPAIEIVRADPAPLDAAIRGFMAYDWIVFTSANAVFAFMERLRALGLDAEVLTSVRIAAIGRATAKRLGEFSVSVDLMPDRFIAESVVAEIVAQGVDGQRVLLPQAEIARDTVAEGLRGAGAIVDVIVAYRTILPDGHDPGEVQRLIAGVDIATFTSPSSVRNVLRMAGGSLPAVTIICIGPVTADAAREAGLTVSSVAETYTADGLVDAIVRLVERAEKEVPNGRNA